MTGARMVLALIMASALVLEVPAPSGE